MDPGRWNTCILVSPCTPCRSNMRRRIFSEDSRSRVADRKQDAHTHARQRSGVPSSHEDDGSCTQVCSTRCTQGVCRASCGLTALRDQKLRAACGSHIGHMSTSHASPHTSHETLDHTTVRKPESAHNHTHVDIKILIDIYS